MEEKSRVVFLIGFLIVTVILAAAFLVETPAGDVPAAVLTALPFDAVLLPGSVSSQTISEDRAAPPKHARFVPENPAPLIQTAERDRNGTPLSRMDYIKAVYVKFPPEGKRG